LTLEPFSWMDDLIRPPQQRRRDREAEAVDRNFHLLVRFIFLIHA
jgi:hypothetical protein